MATVLGHGTPVFGGARATGRLVRVDTPDIVLDLLDTDAGTIATT